MDTSSTHDRSGTTTRVPRIRWLVVVALLGMLGLGAVPGTAGATTGDLVLTGVIDGPLTGGLPKAVELYVVNDIADLSEYGVAAAFNGNPAPAVPTFTFPAVPATAGDHIYLATESPQFTAFFGFAPDFTHGSATNINGDDAIVLYRSGAIVDVFGQPGVDGTGQPWEHLDGWAYRRGGTGQDGATFVLDNWRFSGVDALDGLTTNTGANAFPAGTYSTEPDEPEEPEEPLDVLVHEVQGDGASSPLVGELVTVDAVVVGDFQNGAAGESGDLRGFHVQEEDADTDADPSTSEGLFVFDDVVDVAVGDLVAVTGTVAEFNGLTELTGVTTVVISSGNPLPTPAAVALPDDLGDAPVDWESLEGMRATFGQTLTVTEQFTHGQFGEVVLSAVGAQDHPNQVQLPGSAGADEVALLNQLARIQMDDGRTVSNPDPTPYLQADGTLRDGDAVDGLVGVVHYSFGAYEVHPVSAPAITRLNDRPAAPEVGGTLRVASFNVLNYFTTLGSRGADDAAELEQQAAKIVAAIVELDADVVGLIEIENNGDTAVDDLVARLNAAGPRTYAAVRTGTLGTDVIKVAFIYDTATVGLVGSHHVLDSTVSPAYLDGENRPALAQTFEELATGARFTATINHLKSKGSACTTTSNPGDPAYGVAPYAGDPDVVALRQGNCNLTRLAAAQVLGQWLDDIDATGNTLILGDLNSYANEDPIRALEALGYTDLVEAEAGGNTWALGAHSYVFSGEHGTLDYAMASPDLLTSVTGAAAWHINADEPPALDYNDWNPPANFSADPYRSSDHDPIVVGLSLPQILACNGLDLDGWQEWAGDNGYVLVTGTDGPDLIGPVHPPRRQLVLTMGGDDVVLGSVRDDIICTGDGSDIVLGGNGNDRIEGGDGNDVLLGGNGADRIFGGEGDDLLIGGNGRDEVDGGPGNNVVW